MKNILFFGDSNTWGFNPATCGRYDYKDRWTTVCAEILGKDFNCIPCGMNGRTTVFDDPFKGCRNGLDAVDFELQTHKPIDLAVIMLGTNDLKFTDAEGSAEGIEKVVKKFLTINDRFSNSYPVFPNGAKILLISPILVKNNFVETEHSWDESRESEKFSGLYKGIADKYGVFFMDAKEYSEPSQIDGVHLGIEGHKALGMAISDEILKIFSCGR